MAQKSLPWCGNKVAFSISDRDLVASHWDSIDSQLPNGWKLAELDSSGARSVAVFEVDVELTVTDGELVKKLLQKISRRKRGTS